MRTFLVASLLLIALAATALAPSASAGQRQPGETLRDRVLVKLARESNVQNEGTTGPIGVAGFDQVAREVGATRIKPIFHRPPRGRRDPAAAAAIGLDRWVRVELGSDRADIDEIARKFRSLNSVEVAETDRVIAPAVVPNDPDYSGSQWDLQSTRTNAEGAWDVGTDSSEYVIFVIDTGVELAHTDVDGNLWSNPGEIAGNSVDDDLNGFVDDVNGYNFLNDDADVNDGYGHGIHVNGTIGAEGNNSLQVAGINWTCKLAQGRIFDASGYGTWDAAAGATTYAADNGAIATNNSWGDTAQGPQAYVDAMTYADDVDVLQVAAAGNQGDTAQFWPAAYPEMMSVAATDSADNLAWFSTHGDWIDMAAPGDGIWNLYLGNGTASLSGTSMASPHVCGAGALLRSVNPQLSNDEARITLRLNSDDLGTAGFDNDFGFGRLDIRKAIDAARGISLSTQSVVRPGTVDVTIDAPGEANMFHYVVCGLSGIDPGLDLTVLDPNDFRFFPINYDFFFDFQLQVPNNAYTPGFFDYLDAAGHDVVTFHSRKGNLLKNKRVWVAWCSSDPNIPDNVRFISAPLHFDVQ